MVQLTGPPKHRLASLACMGDCLPESFLKNHVEASLSLARLASAGSSSGSSFFPDVPSKVNSTVVMREDA